MLITYQLFYVWRLFLFEIDFDLSSYDLTEFLDCAVVGGLATYIGLNLTRLKLPKQIGCDVSRQVYRPRVCSHRRTYGNSLLMLMRSHMVLHQVGADHLAAEAAPYGAVKSMTAL